MWRHSYTTADAAEAGAGGRDLRVKKSTGNLASARIRLIQELSPLSTICSGSEEDEDEEDEDDEEEDNDDDAAAPAAAAGFGGTGGSFGGCLLPVQVSGSGDRGGD